MKCPASTKDRDRIWEKWCSRNQAKRCKGCKYWTGREISVYQEEKKDNPGQDRYQVQGHRMGK